MIRVSLQGRSILCAQLLVHISRTYFDHLFFRYLFIEYEDAETAQQAVKGTDGHKLDKQHIFSVNLFTDIDKYSNIDEHWDPPKPQEYKDRGNLRSWLLNPDSYDQYSVLSDDGAQVTIYLNTPHDPVVLRDRETWTEAIVQWSPLGNND